jgi:FlaA1/EpsC-like NDP-sugar epimerase
MADKRVSFVFRNRYFGHIDIGIFTLSAVVSFSIRLESTNLSQDAWKGILLFLAIAAPVRLVIFLRYGMYGRYWKNAGPSELILVAYACLISGIATTTIIFIVSALWTESRVLVPRSIPFIDMLLVTILITVARFSLRANHYLHNHRTHRQRGANTPAQRVLIIGAGQTGAQVLDVLDGPHSSADAVGFLDDDVNKVGTYVRGLKVLGKIGDLQHVVDGYDVNLVVIAIPSAPGKLIRRIAFACHEIGVAYKIMPGIYDLVSGKVSVNTLRPVSIDDLLRREPVALETEDIKRMLRGRCVMITGAGGSIGAELVQQIARCEPGCLLLVGHGENSLFVTQQRLKNNFPKVAYHLLLADVRDIQRMTGLFGQWRPEIVFHAAAHKHVPMLETNIIEAVSNNVIGTRNLVELCNRFEVERMVMISTDKAVNPTNVMGMTKRVAEIIVKNAAHKYPQRFAAVRFGNVLGSRGSVVPTFQQQIATGGPVTVTSEAMSRFFMSIPEAVLLVLKASVLIDYGPLFVLNMGEPVRIVDLAHDLIRLSGLEPERDIEVKITNPRPGEKFYEELYWPYESYQPIEQGAILSIHLSNEYSSQLFTEVSAQIQALIQATQDYNEDAVHKLLKDIAFAVPTAERKNGTYAASDAASSLRQQPAPGVV